MSNAKLKETLDQNNKNNKNIISNTNTNLKSGDLINSKADIPSANNKGNLKRSLKNKRTNNQRNVQIIGADGKDAKEKERMERSKNITYTNPENKKENIAIKSYKDKAIKTKNSKDNNPPKKKGDLVEDITAKENSDSEKKLLGDIVIHKTKAGNKDISSTDKKSFTKEDLLKDNPNTNIQLNEEKPTNKENIPPKKEDNKIFDDFELNHLEYSEALKYDTRLFLRIYWSHLKREHPIVHTFLAWNDYNLFFAKLSKFFFLVTTVMALDALFFSNDSMHNIYTSGGSYNLGYHMVQMILTIIVYEAFQVLLNYLTLTDIDYYKIKGQKDTISQKEVVNIIKCIEYKIIGFYVFTFLVFLFYWYLNSAFCAVYENTQKIFVADSFMCLLFAFIYPLALYLAPTGLRKISFVCRKTKGLKIVYRISQFIPIF